MSNYNKAVLHATILKNGIKVISREHQDSQTGYIEVRVNAGSKYCPPGKEGLAHFLEHMIMHGSLKYPSGTQVKNAVGDLGGAIGAFTNREVMRFWIAFAKEDLAKAGDILFSTVTKPLLAKEKLEGEKKIILEEIAFTKDLLKVKVLNALYSLIFSRHPLESPVSGSAETVKKITLEDLNTFFKNYFVPGNITVFSSGGLEHKRLLKIVSHHFLGLAERRIHTYSTFSNQHGGPRVAVLNEPSNQARLMLAFLLEPSSSLEDLVAADVLKGILNNPDRLKHRLREKEKLAYDVSANSLNHKDASIIEIEGGFKYERADYAISVICEELKALKDKLVNKDELLRVRKKAEVGFLFDLESHVPLANFIFRLNRLLGVVVSPDKYLQALNVVSPIDIQKLAKRIFVPERTFLSISHRDIKGDRLEKIIAEGLS